MRVSPSQVSVWELCNKKFAFKYVEGLKEPQSAAQAEGELGHKRNERWLKHAEHPGDDATGKLIQAAMRPGYLPTPSPELLIEHEFSVPLGGGHSFYGFIDCVVPPSLQELAASRVTVIDHKFVSDLKWAKKPHELRQDPQAIGYGRAALELFPEATEIERRWLYFQKRSTKVLPVSFVQTSLEVLEAWRPLEQTAQEILRVRTLKIAPEQLAGNQDACDAYGGCAFASVCPVPKGSGKFQMAPRKSFTHTVKNSSEPAPTAPDGRAETKMALSLAEQLEQLKREKLGGAAAPAQAAAPAAPAQASPAEAPKITGPLGGKALADLQAAKGATGVNPPASKPIASAAAPATTPAAAPAADPAPEQKAESAAAPAEKPKRKMKLKDAGAHTTGQAPTDASPTAPAEAGASTPATAPPKKFDTPASAATGALSVIFKGAVVKFPGDKAKPVMLIELLAPIMRTVADEANKAHWALIPYNEGKALLAHAFDKWLEATDWKGTIVVDDTSLEAQAVHEVLVYRADTIVRGLA